MHGKWDAEDQILYSSLSPSKDSFVHLTNNLMQKINCNSTAIKELFVDPIKGLAQVVFTNGSYYNYKNVNRLAIMNVLRDQKQSLGSWVNKNLVNDSNVGYQLVGRIEDDGEIVFV